MARSKLDFGLAKLAKGASVGTSTDSSLEDSLTQVGVIPGTAVICRRSRRARRPGRAQRHFFLRRGCCSKWLRQKAVHRGQRCDHAPCGDQFEAAFAAVDQPGGLPVELEKIIGKAMEKESQPAVQGRDRDEGRPGTAEKGTDPTLRSGLLHATGFHTKTKTFQKSSSKLTWVVLGLAAWCSRQSRRFGRGFLNTGQPRRRP